MRARRYEAGFVLANLTVVAIPAVILLSGQAHYAGRWLAVAIGLPLLGLLLGHFRTSSRLEREEESRDGSVSELALVEKLASFGRWSIELQTGRHSWSDEMCRIAGCARNASPTAGQLAELLPSGLSQLDVTLASHARDEEPFWVEFELECPERGSRVLKAHACNVFGPGGVREQVFMVVRDVTDTYMQVARAEQEKHAAKREAEEAMRLANTDPLTGLANRRSAMAALDRAIMAARADGEPLGLLVFDIDCLKAINDAHGHVVGDKVIAEVGRIAARSVRSEQLVARIGGEEFLVILPGANPQATARTAERLRLAIEAGTVSAPLPQVTASIGQAMLEPYDTSLLLFARADEALYVAKREGRNRVACAA